MSKEDELKQLLKLSLFGHLVVAMIIFWLVVFGFKLSPFVQHSCTPEYPEYPVPMPVPTPMPPCAPASFEGQEVINCR